MSFFSLTFKVLKLLIEKLAAESEQRTYGNLRPADAETQQLKRHYFLKLNLIVVKLVQIEIESLVVLDTVLTLS